MNTLIIYDTTGHIISQTSGNVYEPVGLPFIWVEIPEGKYVTNIDISVAPNVAVLADLPKTETKILQQQVFDLTTQLVTAGVI